MINWVGRVAAPPAPSEPAPAAALVPERRRLLPARLDHDQAQEVAQVRARHTGPRRQVRARVDLQQPGPRIRIQVEVEAEYLEAPARRQPGEEWRRLRRRGRKGPLRR